MEPTIEPRKRMPPAVWLGLTLVVLLDTPMQLIWKSLAAHQKAIDGHQVALAGTMLSRTQGLIAQPLFWVLLLLFGLQFLNWMWVLGEADLSFAQPFTALSYLTISSGAVWIFREHLSVGRISGIALILGGVLLVGSTPHKTVATE